MFSGTTRDSATSGSVASKPQAHESASSDSDRPSTGTGVPSGQRVSVTSLITKYTLRMGTGTDPACGWS